MEDIVDLTDFCMKMKPNAYHWGFPSNVNPDYFFQLQIGRYKVLETDNDLWKRTKRHPGLQFV